MKFFIHQLLIRGISKSLLALIAFIVVTDAAAIDVYADKCLASGLKGGTPEFVACYANLKESIKKSSFDESSLPECPGSWVKETWSECFGRREEVNGRTYVGEFFANQKQGLGVRYEASGVIESSGVWKWGSLVSSQQLTSTRFAFNPTSSSNAASLSVPSVESTLVAGKRLALVIGNSNYRVRPLRNPINDANDVSYALKSSGFQVIDLRDASLQQMRAGVRQFGDRLINNDVGLVYYSGHGVEVKGRNYFIPVNADIQREDEIADQGLDVNLVLEKMSTAGKGVNILIVDACRDDPFGRSFRSSSRGLANMDAPRGTIIAYATAPGKVAQDGDGRNSPYTKNLVRAMQQPNKPIEQVFKEVRRAVQDETKNQQTPWENTSLSGDFYFRVQR